MNVAGWLFGIDRSRPCLTKPPPHLQVALLSRRHLELGAQTGLFEDVPADGFMNGTPAVPFGLERRLVVLSRRLPELFKKVDSLAASLDSAKS